MSWLSDGLNQFSNITGQISSFTKEVLTETTEEVTDPSAELEVLRQKHAELIKSHQLLEAELCRSKKLSDDRKEQIETAEFQISTISQEYRKLVESRDAEIRRLKTENEKLREEAKGFIYSGAADPHSPLKELAELHLGVSALTDVSSSGMRSVGGDHESVDVGDGEWMEHYHEDFSDVITSQAEINQLRLQLSKLRVEIQYWKKLAENKNEEGVGTAQSEQVKTLEVSTQKHHEQELSSLQIVHQQKIQSMSKRHQQEIGQLQEQVILLQQKSKSSDISMSGQRTQELEELNSTLVSQLNQLKSNYREEQKTNSELLHKLKQEQLSTSQLTAEIKLLKDQSLQEKSLQEHLLSKEKEKLKHHLDEMQVRILEHQNTMSALQQEHERAKSKSTSLQEQLRTLSNQLYQKEVEINNLKQELRLHEERLQQSTAGVGEQAPQFEKVVGKLEEKGEGELEVLRKELDNAMAREEILKTKCSQMEHSLSERSNVTTGRTEQVTQVSQEDCKQALEKELSKALTAQSNLMGLLTAREEEIKSLEETNLSNKSVISKLCTDKEEAIKEWETLRVVNMSLNDDLLKLKTKGTTGKERQLLKSEDGQLMILQQENAKCTKQLANLKSHLIEIQEQHTQESIKADEREADLKQQLINLQECLMESRNTETKLNVQNEQLVEVEHQFQAMKEERDDALLRMANAQDQADMNAESIRNLQTVLEQFQRDQSSELGQALKKSQLELADSLSEYQRLKKEYQSLQEELMGAHAAADVSSTSSRELEMKESRISQLLEEGEGLKFLLQDSQATVEKLTREAQVDRSLVKNLVLGYVQATDTKKPEVLQLISKILEFSADELEQALCAHSKSKGWLTGLWKGSANTTKQSEAHASLSQLFIKFLELESAAPRNSPSSTGHHTVSGYIDPHTDPDKPSLATASLLSSAQPAGPHTHVQPAKDYSKCSPIDQTPSTSQNSFQSTFLKSVLTD